MESWKKPIKENKELFEHIFSNALGNVIILTAAPTQNSDMKANTIGYYDNTIYLRLGTGGIQKFTTSDL